MSRHAMTDAKTPLLLLGQSLNVVAAVQALSPKGAAGLPPPPAEIFSVPSDYVS